METQTDTTQADLTISAVVCTWSLQRWDSLVKAVESLRRQTLAPSEIVVVVDHNHGLLERVRDQMPDVVAVENSAPERGISGTRNTGVMAARGDIIAFLDDDAVTAPDWLDVLAAGFADPDVMGVGGPVEPNWMEGRPTWFPKPLDWVVGCTFEGMPETVQPVQRLISCNMAFRKAVFEEIGGFRPGIGRIGSIPVAGEETEFCIRAKRRWPDRIWLYNVNAPVSHLVPPHRASWSYFRSRCYAEGVSKALIARQVGSQAGLEVERAYVTRTLPKAVLQGATDALRERDPEGLARAGSVIAGLAIVTAGYLVGSAMNLSERLRGQEPSQTAA